MFDKNWQSRGLIKNILDNQIDIYSFISDGRRLDETRELTWFLFCELTCKWVQHYCNLFGTKGNYKTVIGV